MTTNHKSLVATILLLFVYFLPISSAETYTQDFDGFDNGTVDLNDGSVI